MIIGFILNLLYFFISILIGFLPVGGDVSVSWVSGIYTVWAYVNMFSFVVPVNMLVTRLGIAMAFHLFVFAWHAIHWIYSLIRGYHY